MFTVSEYVLWRGWQKGPECLYLRQFWCLGGLGYGIISNAADLWGNKQKKIVLIKKNEISFESGKLCLILRPMTEQTLIINKNRR